MDLDDVRSEDGEYLDLSENDYLAIMEALMSDMVNIVVKLRDIIDKVCLQDDFERNKITRNRRKKVDTSMWQVNKNKKILVKVLMFTFLVLCKKQHYTSDNEYSLHFHVHRRKWKKIVDFREPHIPCNTH